MVCIWYTKSHECCRQKGSREKDVGDYLLHCDNILLMDRMCSIPCSTDFEFHPKWEIGNSQQSLQTGINSFPWRDTCKIVWLISFVNVGIIYVINILKLRFWFSFSSQNCSFSWSCLVLPFTLHWCELRTPQNIMALLSKILPKTCPWWKHIVNSRLWLNKSYLHRSISCSSLVTQLASWFQQLYRNQVCHMAFSTVYRNHVSGISPWSNSESFPKNIQKDVTVLKIKYFSTCVKCVK